MSPNCIMSSGHKTLVIKKKHLKVFFILVLIIGVIVGGYYLYSSTFQNRDFWNKIDSYEQAIENCTYNIASDMNTLNFYGASSKIEDCKRKVNEVLVEVHSEERKSPSNKELKAASISYGSAGNMLDALKNVVDIRTRDLSKAGKIAKGEAAIRLLDEALNQDNQLEREYADTKYYRRYYLTEKEKHQESVKAIRDFKAELASAMDTLKTCSADYILGNDYECYEQCGGADEYCGSGSSCFNGKCVSCPSGYVLGSNGNCYPGS